MSVAPHTDYCHACRGEVVSQDGRCPWCATELLTVELPEMPPAERRVSSEPFLAWAVEERVRLVNVARERGEHVHNNDRGGRKLLDELRISSSAWMFLCQRTLITVDRVTELLANAGVTLEEVYGPEPEIIYGRGKRRRRRGPVTVNVTPLPTPGEDGWEPIEQPDDAYQPTTPIVRQGAYGRERYLTDEQLRYAVEAYLVVPVIKFATEEVERRYGLCGYKNFMGLYQGIQKTFRRQGWLKDRAKMERDLQAVRMPAPKTRRKLYVRRSRVPEWLIYEAAYRYYWDQWGFQRLGRYFYPQVRTLYTRPMHLENAIYREFTHRGWPRRSRIEATRIASFKHGLAARDRYTKPRAEGEGPYRSWLRHKQGIVRPQCKGTTTRGTRCARAATTGMEYCPGHDPERQTERVEHMRRMQNLSHQANVPIEPFAVWMDHKRDEFPTLKAMAEAVAAATGRRHTSIQSMILHVRNRDRLTIRRGTVEMFLVALGDSEAERRLHQDTADAIGVDPTDGVTFEDLYGPYVRGSDD